MTRTLFKTASVVCAALVMAGASATDQPRPSEANGLESTQVCKEAKPGGTEDIVRKLYADYPFDGRDVVDRGFKFEVQRLT